MYKIECGRYPTTAEGLDALINRPANVPPTKWTKYLDADRVPNDPWGHPYVYRCPGLHNTNTFDIYSGGLTGTSKSGGDDPYDINNWNPSSPLAWPQEYETHRRQQIRCVGGAAIFVLVLAVTWLNKRIRKSEGNLLGIFALLLLSATPLLLMATQWIVGAAQSSKTIRYLLFSGG